MQSTFCGLVICVSVLVNISMTILLNMVSGVQVFSLPFAIPTHPPNRRINSRLQVASEDPGLQTKIHMFNSFFYTKLIQYVSWFDRHCLKPS